MFKNLFKRKKQKLYDESFVQNSLETTENDSNKPIKKLSKKKKIAIAIIKLIKETAHFHSPLEVY